MLVFLFWLCVVIGFFTGGITWGFAAILLILILILPAKTYR